jgi:hypothetical protein
MAAYQEKDTGAGKQLGTAIDQLIAFHGSTPVAQRAGVAQAAVVTTAPTNSTPYGFTQAQATAILTLLNELRAALVEKGIIKGAA